MGNLQGKSLFIALQPYPEVLRNFALLPSLRERNCLLWNYHHLCGKGYKIGVIANQSAGAAKRLKKWGLLKYIDVVAASAEIGVAIDAVR